MCYFTVRRTKWASSYEWNILTGKVSTEYILVKKFNEPRFVLVHTRKYITRF